MIACQYNSKKVLLQLRPRHHLVAIYDAGRPPEQRYLDLVCQALRSPDGSITGVFAQGIDVTERRSAEQELREASLRKDEFLATPAHELRNPFAPIRSGLAVLQMQSLPGQAETVLSMMDRQLTQLVQLVDNLLDVSRVTTGKTTLRKENVDFRDVVNAAIETSRPAIKSARHEFIAELPEELLPLHADRIRMVQVLTNLLNNACIYTPIEDKSP